MRTAHGILEEYRKADFHKRLNLYLQYRDLRSKFAQIESAERAVPQVPVSEKRASGVLSTTGSTGYRIARSFIPGK
jgi:hypothetical protein